MAKSSLKKIQLEASCPVCLLYFTDPVTLECGHSFCTECIKRFWRDFVPTTICPRCKREFEMESFMPNKPLENFSTFFKEVAKNEAEPVETCERHSEPLNYFCKDDTVPLCSLCSAAEEHQGHRLVPLKDVALEMKIYISTCLKFLRNREQAIQAHKAKVETKSQEMLERVKTLRQETDNVFRGLHASLIPVEDYLVDKLQSITRDIEDKKNERMSKLFWEVVSNESLNRELQRSRYLSASEFLQNAQKVFKKCEQRVSYEPPTSIVPEYSWKLWDLFDNGYFMKHTLMQFKETLDFGSSLNKAIVSLDPATAHPQLVLSEDNRSVRVGEEPQDLPRSYKRFETNFFVLGRKGFGKGRVYWDVIVGSEEGWAVGIARKSVKRKGMVAIDSDAGIWAIGKRGDQYMAYKSPGTSPLSLDGDKDLKRIRICLNCIGRRVAFFDIDDVTFLFQTPITAAPQGSFFPFFHVSNKAVLTIAPQAEQGAGQQDSSLV